jgi:hypothetical protein
MLQLRERGKGQNHVTSPLRPFIIIIPSFPVLSQQVQVDEAIVKLMQGQSWAGTSSVSDLGFGKTNRLLRILTNEDSLLVRHDYGLHFRGESNMLLSPPPSLGSWNVLVVFLRSSAGH